MTTTSDHEQSPAPATNSTGTRRVAIIGSGNWGTTVAWLVGGNLERKPELREMGFVPRIEMYVYEETLPDGQELTDVINKYHQNTKYLPGVLLPDGVSANPDVAATVRNATHLLIVSPHEFVPRLAKQMRAAMTDKQRETIGVLNLAKGLCYVRERKALLRVTEILAETLEVPPARVGALSGPNVASEVAQGYVTEATVACQDAALRAEFAALFHRPEFAVRQSTDVAGVELGGALKNIVAIAAGMVDGLGLGNNAKATIIRIGMVEMLRFGSLDLFANKPRRLTVATPAWIGDALTTCYGGRNRKYGEALGRCFRDGFPPIRVEDFQKRALGGQMVQGYTTTVDVIEFLRAHDRVREFPMFDTVYQSITAGLDPRERFVEIVNSVE